MSQDELKEKKRKPNTEKLKILLEAMQRRGKSNLLDERMMEIVLKKIGMQKGLA